MSIQTIAEAKARAKTLRTALAGQGTTIGHAQALELVARQEGARDWNTLHARLAKAEASAPVLPVPVPPVPVPPVFQIDQRVEGTYLGQPFTGVLKRVARAGEGWSLTIRFDTPIDTVRFESFSNLRQQINGSVDAEGISPRRTSDGEPQLVVRPA